VKIMSISKVEVSNIKVGSRLKYGSGITGTVTRIVSPYGGTFKIFDIEVDAVWFDQVYSEYAVISEWNIEAIL
jgi:hypothetical protein